MGKTAAAIISDYIMESAGIDELNYDYDIFNEGLVNSLFAIELMVFLEKTFGIKVTMDDLDMENFKTVNRIAAFIHRKQGG